ncbi:MAG: hypothetical protein J6U68_02150 [Clostridia bacterium]|nr:hypothetical protein [Clostridia bacterium]
MKNGYNEMKCGLLGEHLLHSFSPLIHKMLGDYDYNIYDIPEGKLEDFVKNGTLDAFNVTIPYKKAVMPMLDEISDEACAIGAVNVVVRKNGKLCGYNTDYFGFAYMVDSAKVDVRGKKAVLFGNGGAAATIRKVLADKKVGELVIIDKDDNTPENIALHSDASVIINATPVGTFPNNGKAVTDLSLFPNCEAVLDIVYNPARTALILDAKKRGITAVGGLSMLVAQAARGFEIFTGDYYEDGIIEKLIDRISRDTQNIILVGMPSSGKSTIGALLANSLERPLLDADEEFESMHSISPANAIKTLGEPKFRDMEEITVASLGKLSGKIIATGGGAITRENNYPSLHQNGVIVYIKRDINKLSTEGRPLSQANPLAELYEKRKAFYERFADITVENNGTPEETAKNIENALKSFNYTCIYPSKKEL